MGVAWSETMPQREDCETESEAELRQSWVPKLELGYQGK